jgi:hypothetical protein
MLTDDFSTPTTGFKGIGVYGNVHVKISSSGRVVIDARKQDCIFAAASGASLTLVSVTLQNATYNFGAIWLGQDGSVHVEDCIFIGNVATQAPLGGGAIFVYDGAGGAGSVTVVNCMFTESIDTSKGNNGIARNSGSVTFACPEGTTGLPVIMQQQNLLVTQLPPAKQVVQCT